MIAVLSFPSALLLTVIRMSYFYKQHYHFRPYARLAGFHYRSHRIWRSCSFLSIKEGRGSCRQDSAVRELPAIRNMFGYLIVAIAGMWKQRNEPERDAVRPSTHVLNSVSTCRVPRRILYRAADVHRYRPEAGESLLGLMRRSCAIPESHVSACLPRTRPQ